MRNMASTPLASLTPAVACGCEHKGLGAADTTHINTAGTQHPAPRAAQHCWGGFVAAIAHASRPSVAMTALQGL
jgi:hypothetical protein